MNTSIPPAEPNTLRFTLLGYPQIRLDAAVLDTFSTKKSQALLIYLAIEGQPKSREELASIFWQEMPSDRARKNLRGALYHLRKTVGDHLDITPQTVAMAERSANGTSVDAIQFRMLLNDISGQRTHDLRRALTLYQGDFLDGFSVRKAPAFDCWSKQRREELRQLAIQRALRLIQNDISASAYEDGLETSEWLLNLAPRNEHAHYYKLLTLFQLDKRTMAMEHYEYYRELLVEAHQMKPLPQIDALIESNGVSLPPRSSQIPLQDIAQPQNDLIEEKDSSKPNSPHGQSSLFKPTWAAAPSEERVVHSIQKPLNDSFPSYQTSYIGYTNEIARARQLLTESNYRLLTITGPGGVGKTRLAVETVHQLTTDQRAKDRDGGGRFKDGIYFVALMAFETADPEIETPPQNRRSARLTASDKIIVAIANTLRLRFQGNAPPKTQLLRYISTKHLLLVLDGFEELLPGSSTLTELLSEAPNLWIVVTSRERLNLYSERLVTLEGLSTASGSENRGTAITQENLALTFFIDRLRSQTARLGELPSTPTVDEIELMQRICVLTGGIPLALEIATSLTIQMGLATTVGLLENDLSVLKFRGEGLEERHRSILALLDATWQRLNKQEQEILRQLVIFKGGFSLDAAQTITGASHALLAGLVNKSIIWVTDRYRMHTLVNQYIRQKSFTQDADTSESRQRLYKKHQEYFQGYLIAQLERWQSTQDGQTIANLSIEYDNIMAAWQWLSTQNPLSSTLVPFTKALWQLAQQRGRLQEMEQILREVLERVYDDSSLADEEQAVAQAELLRLLSATYYSLGDLNSSDTQGLEALQLLGHNLPSSRLGYVFAIAQALGSTLRNRLSWSVPASPMTQKSMIGWIYNSLTQNNYMHNQLPGAALCALRAANLAEQTNDYALQATTFSRVSILFGMVRLGGLQRSYMKLAEQAASDASDRAAKTTVPYMRGLYLISEGKCDSALPLIKAALEQYRQTQEWRSAGDCLALLNIIACHQGRHEDGLAYGIEMAEIAERGQNVEHEAWSHLIKAVNLSQLGHAAEALVQIERVEPLYQRLNFKDIGISVGYSTLALAHSRLGEYHAAFETAKQLTKLPNRDYPTSPIYLYVYHAILEVFLHLIELTYLQAEEQLSTNHSVFQQDTDRSVVGANLQDELLDFDQDELQRYTKGWLRKLAQFSLIHPIGKQFLWLHQGRLCHLTNKPKRAEQLFKRGLEASQRLGHHRNAGRFQYEMGRYIATDKEEKRERLETANMIYQGLQTPVGLKIIQTALEQVANN